MARRDEFVRLALTWDGVPWRKTGSTREGTNCLGLPVGVARELGGYEDLVALGERMAMFSRPLTPRMMVDGMMGHMVIKSFAEAVPGDLLLFRIDDRPDHVAIIVSLNPLQFIHADTVKRRVRVTTMPSGWIPIGAFRVEDLDDE